MNDRIRRMKIELKALTAKRIELKRKHNNPYSGYIEIRSKHIAYCLLRGTPYEKIETKHRDPKNGTHEYVKKEADRIVEKVTKGEMYGPEDIRPSRQAPVEIAASCSVWTRLVKFLV